MPTYIIVRKAKQEAVCAEGKTEEITQGAEHEEKTVCRRGRERGI